MYIPPKRVRRIRVIATTLYLILTAALAMWYGFTFSSVLLFLAMAAIWKLLLDWQLYLSISRHGVSVQGKLVSFARPLWGFGLPSGVNLGFGKANITFRGTATAEVVVDGKTQELPLWGAFYHAMGEPGTSVNLAFWDEYADIVVVASPQQKKTYLMHTVLWCLFWTLMLVGIYFGRL